MHKLKTDRASDTVFDFTFFRNEKLVEVQWKFNFVCEMSQSIIVQKLMLFGFSTENKAKFSGEILKWKLKIILRFLRFFKVINGNF